VGLIHSNKAYRSLAKQVFESREGKSFRGHVKKIISPFPEISYGFRTLHMWHGAINSNNSLLYLETQNTVASRLLGMILNNFIVNPFRIMSLA